MTARGDSLAVEEVLVDLSYTEPRRAHMLAAYVAFESLHDPSSANPLCGLRTISLPVRLYLRLVGIVGV